MKHLFLALLLALPLSAAREHPNILFLLSDDQAWSDYGFMGHAHIRTPALDRLAQESLLYTRGYTPVPLCRPSLASILTGLYPHQHGVTGNDPDLPGTGLNAMAQRGHPEYAKFYTDIIARWQSHPNWIRSLKDTGYTTLQTGKWWEGNPVKDGNFTEAMTHGDPKRGGRHGDAGLAIGRKGLAPIKDFITRSGDQPWFVWYGVFLPHTPHNPPQELLEKYLEVAPSEPVARYWACCEWLDHTIGELLSFLEEKGLREDTIIVYTCDNGWIQHPEKINRFAPRSKLSVYEGGIRTPIMLSWKGTLAPRRDDTHLASNLDLWPTLAKLCQTPLPPELPGVDLTDRSAVAARDTIFGEGYAHNIAKLGEPARSLQTRFVIEGDWKLIIPHSANRPQAGPELFHLKNDPWEKQNLAGQHPKRMAGMRRTLDAWWTP